MPDITFVTGIFEGDKVSAGRKPGFIVQLVDNMGYFNNTYR